MTTKKGVIEEVEITYRRVRGKNSRKLEEGVWGGEAHSERVSAEAEYSHSIGTGEVGTLWRSWGVSSETDATQSSTN